MELRQRVAGDYSSMGALPGSVGVPLPAVPPAAVAPAAALAAAPPAARPVVLRDPAPPPPFLTKTHDMLTNTSLSNYVTWGEGDSVIIQRIQDFAVDVLPRFFKHSNYSSFVRQLHIYGFRKIRDDGQGCHEFRHPLFFRGSTSDDLKAMRRKKVAGTEAGSSSGAAVDPELESASSFLAGAANYAHLAAAVAKQHLLPSSSAPAQPSQLSQSGDSALQICPPQAFPAAATGFVLQQYSSSSSGHHGSSGGTAEPPGPAPQAGPRSAQAHHFQVLQQQRPPPQQQQLVHAATYLGAAVSPHSAIYAAAAASATTAAIPAARAVGGGATPAIGEGAPGAPVAAASSFFSSASVPRFSFAPSSSSSAVGTFAPATPHPTSAALGTGVLGPDGLPALQVAVPSVAPRTATAAAAAPSTVVRKEKRPRKSRSSSSSRRRTDAVAASAGLGGSVAAAHAASFVGLDPLLAPSSAPVASAPGGGKRVKRRGSTSAEKLAHELKVFYRRQREMLERVSAMELRNEQLARDNAILFSELAALSEAQAGVHLILQSAVTEGVGAVQALLQSAVPRGQRATAK